ncbi:MAG: CesT family type III secretion system chaperone [Chlamydiia bacterium]|nr:CesT family type III secretion system chaperone [Chlamydiia bacterium]
MIPFEDLIRELGEKIGTPLHVDPHQSCLLEFSPFLHVQIDLDSSADKILLGTQLGNLLPGPYRENILRLGMIVNGMMKIHQGIVAYSEKNDSLVLFAYLPIATTTADILFDFLAEFLEHAHIWEEALRRGEIPKIEEETKSSGFFGLKK